jgi:hypothetical protein
VLYTFTTIVGGFGYISNLPTGNYEMFVDGESKGFLGYTQCAFVDSGQGAG